MTKYERNPDVIATLSDEEFWVTQKNGTERPGTGRLLYNNEPGIYVDIVSGEPLFASTDKYESGCGWPSFTKPIETDNVVELSDNSLGMARIEDPVDSEISDESSDDGEAVESEPSAAALANDPSPSADSELPADE